MANNFEFHDYSPQAKRKIKDLAIAWLHTWANETAAQAKRNTSTEGWTNGERTSLRDSYGCVVDEANLEATVGTPMEQGFWEEFGTGSHADTAKNGGKQGRSGWWIYTPGSEGPEGYKSRQYATKEEAEDMAAYIKSTYNKETVVTDGREPNYTLEKSFIAVSPKAKRDLQNKLKGL